MIFLGRKFLALLCIILLFTPTFVAIGYFSSTKKEPRGADDVTDIRIKDINGSEWEFDLDDGDTAKNIIDIFVSMNKNAAQEDAIPALIKSKIPFSVTMTSFGQERAYEYYFTGSASEAYYADSAGNAFKIAEADAAKFLSTVYARSVFTDGKLPMLVVGGEKGVAVNPCTAVWSYIGYDSKAEKLDTSYLSTDPAECSISGGLSLSFTDEPDYVYITVKNPEDSSTIFDGTKDNIESLSLDGVKAIDVEVSAQWFMSETVTNEATYRFRGNIVEPATFYLGQTSVENGNFVVIGGKNVTRPEEILFSSSPELNYTPTFYTEGAYVYALIPISYELEDGEDKTFTFTISYGGLSQNMNLEVTSYEYKETTSKITAAVEEATYSEAARAEAEEALHELAKTEKLADHTFEGTFLREVVGENSEELISPGFGRKVTVTETGTQFQHTGVDYNVAAGTEVKAVNTGQVIYSGYLTTTGYIVVIDHGWGLKSWYCHLSECKVEVGAKVEKGATIGLSGDTGFAAKNRTHVGLTVGDIPVNIYNLWDTPVAIPDMSR